MTPKKKLTTQFFVFSFKSVGIQGSILSMRAALVSPCAKTPNAATMSSACRVSGRKNVESNVIIMGFWGKIIKHHGNLSGQKARDQKPTYPKELYHWCSTLVARITNCSWMLRTLFQGKNLVISGTLQPLTHPWKFEHVPWKSMVGSDVFPIEIVPF